MKKALLIIFLITTLLPANALWFFKKKKKKTVEAAPHINREILIKKKYQSRDGIFDIKLSIFISPKDNHVIITTLYDELNERAIEDMIWVAENPKKGKKPKRIEAFKVREVINKKAEEYKADYNPSQAYDRFAENKHIINKSFYFKKSDIFGNNERVLAHFLELDFPQKLKKKLRLDQKIYEKPSEVVPELFKHESKEEIYSKYQEYEAQQNQDLKSFQEATQKLKGFEYTAPKPLHEPPQGYLDEDIIKQQFLENNEPLF